MGQQATALANRPQGSLPSNTEKNPKEQTNIIGLQSGKQLEQKQPKNIDAESSEGATESNKEEHRKPEDNKDQQKVNLSSERLINRQDAEAKPDPEPVKKAPVNLYVSPVPFPLRLRKQNTDKQFS